MLTICTGTYTRVGIDNRIDAGGYRELLVLELQVVHMLILGSTLIYRLLRYDRTGARECIGISLGDRECTYTNNSP